MIIGITGKNGSGKSTVCEFLKQRGYVYYSLSDMIRESLKEKNIEITREALIEEGSFLRKQYGPQILADRISKKLDKDKNYVIDSIRNPVEVQKLKENPHFFLLKIDADPKVRFERCVKRGRESTETSMEDFILMEEKEWDNKDPSAQQLKLTFELADFSISNNGDLNELSDHIIAVLKSLAAKKVRPSWDQYFMNIAKVVAERSNCVKRHVASVIVQDMRIIATGYNGTPRGIPNCYEGGCPRCNSYGESGTNLSECLCSHAEENAITQAAYHGVKIKGASLYTTFSPCLICTKLIINSGIREVVYQSKYAVADREIELLKTAGVIIRPIDL